jgi:membrane protein
MAEAQQTSTLKRWSDRVRGRVDDVGAYAERTIFWRVWERMLENEFIDRSIALAGKAFVSFFPAIIVVAAFAPASVRASMLTTVTHRLGLSGPGLTTVRSAFATANDTRKATGFVGLIFTFFYINSFTTALGRVYLRAWRRPKTGTVTGYALGASWLVGIVVFFALIGGVRHVLSSNTMTPLFALVALAASIGLWWATAWIMLERRVRWRALSASGVATGAMLGIYGATASLWMPNTVTSNQHQFGIFGVTIALVTWLSGAGMIIVIGACTGAVAAADEGIIGRLTRGNSSEVLVPGAPPSLPAPINAATLATAIGRGRRPVDDDDN